MEGLELSCDEAERAFDGLVENYKVVAPKRIADKGRFSDTDIVSYDMVESLSDIVFNDRTYFSSKSVFFPIRETMFNCDKGRIEDARIEEQPTIIFLRACDINAINVLDAMFLENGGYQDCYYKRHRESVKVFLLECPRPFADCFCASMETNKTDNYSVFMRKEENGYAIKINDEAFMKYFSEGAKAKVEPHFVEDDLDALNIPDFIDCSLFRNKIWEEYSQRCIACGRCNTSCPTCTCFTVQDIAVEDNMQKSERQRIWSSCQVKNFSLLAGDHDFRIPKGDRMRYKVLHKIVDFRKKFGFNMCVGCGRCDQVCPEYISMAKCIKKINEICIADKEEKLW